MRNKKFIVTGSSSGIGKCITEKLLELGATVMGISRTINNTQIQNDAKLIRKSMDFSQHSSLLKHLSDLQAETQQLDGIICCAGYGQFGSLEELSFQQLQQQMDVNFLAHVYLCKTFVPLLKKQQYGKIIFLGSEAALKGSKKGSIYCASKFALRGFAQALREECSRNHVNVTMINPGMVHTPFYDKQNFEPGADDTNRIPITDISDTVLYVLSHQNTVIDEINLSPIKHVVRHKKG